MALYRPLPFVHHVLAKQLTPQSYVIDATLGNGHDAVFMTDILGRNGRFFGFDLQPQALTSTKTKLAAATCRVRLFCQNHATMYTTLQQFEQHIDCVIFNLGFLPHDTSPLTTLWTTTYSAMIQAIGLLRQRGILIIVSYPGHTEGKEEHSALERLLQRVSSQHFYITTYQQINGCNHPPVVYIIEKLPHFNRHI